MSTIGLARLCRGRLLLTSVACGLLAGGANATIIYQNDFESGVGSEFTNNGITLAPNASTSFLGQFAGSGAAVGTTLTLNGLISHSDITISFDVYIIHSWDGNDGGSGPDGLKISADGTDLVNATFCNWNPSQSYSDATPLGGGPFAAKTGADAENTLGYGDYYGTNTVYTMSFTLNHSASSLTVDFAGINLQHVNDESWGIDNVVVSSTAVPEPATVAMLGMGALAFLRRRSKR